MSANINAQLLEVAERWRKRARTFSAEAAGPARTADIIRLTAMASTLEWAASDLYSRIDVKPAE